MKKRIALMLALTMLLTLSACGAEKTEAPETPEEPMADVGVPNPILEADAETILEELGISMEVPEGAEKLNYAIIDAEPRVAQMNFTLNGCDYTYRMVSSAFGEEKIDGMYYEWENTREIPVGYLTGTLNWNEGGAGEALWFDIVPGMLYSLTTNENASPEALTALAAELFVPLQGEVGGDPAAVLEEQLTAALERITTDCRPGTSGATLTAANCCAEICDLLTVYAPGAEQVKEIGDSFRASLEPDQLSLFRMQLKSVLDQFSQITGENAAGLLEDCGYERIADSWDAESLEELLTALNGGSGEEIFAAILADYAAAKSEEWDREKLLEKGLNYMAQDSAVGYLCKDVDEDGTLELLIGSMDDDNPFMRGMILDFYTQDESGAPRLVFQAGERDRWYSLSDTLFRHEGSSGAADSFSYHEQYLFGRMMIMNDAIGDVQPLALTPVGE